jgi:hypothetical protein
LIAVFRECPFAINPSAFRAGGQLNIQIPEHAFKVRNNVGRIRWSYFEITKRILPRLTILVRALFIFGILSWR